LKLQKLQIYENYQTRGPLPDNYTEKLLYKDLRNGLKTHETHL